MKFSHTSTRDAYVRADSRLAEHLCGLRLTDLTVERARELRKLHNDHRPDDCRVHLAAAARLLS
ncbi:hypothetical protein [Nocardia noduli]|uniref:hypothetical protein n=1 Tax=Nocardia noduli TaxID=2815722 RepID=UPI001C234E5C|nr:hypothetical protein [Nocardia noduli]